MAGVYILAVKEWVFHLGLAFLRSCFVLLYYIFLLPCLSLCFLLLVDVFQFAMWSNLHSAVPRDDLELSYFADSFPDVALAGRAPQYRYQVLRDLRQMDTMGARSGPTSCSLSLRSLLASLDGGSQDRCSHRVCRSCH